MGDVIQFNRKQLSIVAAHQEHQDSIKKLEMSKLIGELSTVYLMVTQVADIQWYCLANCESDPKPLETIKVDLRKRRDFILNELQKLDNGE